MTDVTITESRRKELKAFCSELTIRKDSAMSSEYHKHQLPHHFDLKKSASGLLRRMKSLNFGKKSKDRIQATVPGPCYLMRHEVAVSSSMRKKAEKAGKEIYEPLDLAFATVERLKAAPDEAQKKGIKDWNAWRQRNRSLDQSEWNMEGLVDIFSDIFFLKKLRFPVEVIWDNNVSGFGSSRHLHGEGNGIRIRLNPTDHSKLLRTLDNHFTAVISIFLHELVHAVLFSFCCDVSASEDEACRKSGERVWPSEEGSGHCIGWFLIACQFSVCMQEKLGLNGHLLALRSVIRHCEAGGTMRTQDWKLFFETFDWDNVAGLFANLDFDPRDKKRLREHLIKDEDVCRVWVAESMKY